MPSLTGPFVPTGGPKAGHGAGGPGGRPREEHLPVPAAQTDRAQLLAAGPTAAEGQSRLHTRRVHAALRRLRPAPSLHRWWTVDFLFGGKGGKPHLL